jgi:hypothetical protein
MFVGFNWTVLWNLKLSQGNCLTRCQSGKAAARAFLTLQTARHAPIPLQVETPGNVPSGDSLVLVPSVTIPNPRLFCKLPIGVTAKISLPSRGSRIAPGDADIRWF